MSDPGSASLSAAELQRLSAFLYRQTGMLFGETKRYYIERRLADRYAATGISDFATYFGRLRTDAAERETLVNAFTINETYFYREEHQLACLSRSLLPELITTRQPGDKIRIWSVPCSTGEEAYSIAIWLLENWRLVDAYHVEIIGSDIDTRVLEAAREGLYGERALSRLPPGLRDAYFEPARRHQRRIIQDLRESVSFSPANLIDAASMAVHGVFDVIFCRNVLIYFDEESRLLAAGNLFDRLAPAGFLCLGHTESMSRISQRFDVRRFEDATVFQRPPAT
ncbi:protein-glutamate O-methyltransferase CheR [Roseomonas frigidaquae]|uniref:protein-glutamate O-methyltransferase n=1 Tax=Falsiroseomonas frigidaquae TaxID=487318 RepID=A0ABX1F663_9PROT|nr:protein-glutamate O-methyltransferase CheR [Falsiroseomonas frigidaquae]NKE47755.1 protein-glutamate O-methyltransferase CheR [Falsiroseomonas frigidaquae]